MDKDVDVGVGFLLLPAGIMIAFGVIYWWNVGLLISHGWIDDAGQGPGLIGVVVLLFVGVLAGFSLLAGIGIVIAMPFLVRGQKDHIDPSLM